QGQSPLPRSRQDPPNGTRPVAVCSRPTISSASEQLTMFVDRQNGCPQSINSTIRGLLRGRVAPQASEIGYDIVDHFSGPNVRLGSSMSIPRGAWHVRFAYKRDR